MPSRRVFKERILREARQQSSTGIIALDASIAALPVDTAVVATDSFPFLDSAGVAYRGAASLIRTYVLGISGGVATIPENVSLGGTLAVVSTTSLAQVTSATGSRVNVGPTSTSTQTILAIRGPAATQRQLDFRTSDVLRWAILASSDAESGANAGTALQIFARDDSGAAIDTPLSITRSAGGTIAFSSARPITGGTYNGQTITSAAIFTGSVTVTTDLVVNGNTTLGNASGDTLTIAPNAVTWSNNPTHSGNHTFSGNVTVNGNTVIGNATTDTVAFTAQVASNLLPNNALRQFGSTDNPWLLLWSSGVRVNVAASTPSSLTSSGVSSGTFVCNAAAGVGVIGVANTEALKLRHADSGTTPTIPTTGRDLAGLSFQAATGTTGVSSCATIYARATENWSASTAGAEVIIMPQPNGGFVTALTRGFVFAADTSTVVSLATGLSTLRLVPGSSSLVIRDSANTLDAATFNAAGTLLTLNGGFVVNEVGGNNDTRIEGDTDTNLVFVDASTDRVGIGTATPGYKFDVNGDANATGYRVGGTAGFTGTGAYTNFTIVGGIITAAT